MSKMIDLTNTSLSMLKLRDDIPYDVLFVSENGYLKPRKVTDLSLNIPITRNLVDIEYNKKDNILYFLFDNGDIIDIAMPTLSAFGRGPVGKRGEPGDKGRDGLDGKDGSDGNQGCPGIPGVQGKRGLIGEQGDKGSKGQKGQKGNRGQIGIMGPQGYRGYPNDDVNDPCATLVDPKSIGLQGDDGEDGTNITHFSFCRESEPPRNDGPNTIWGKIHQPVYAEPEYITQEPPCSVRPTEIYPPLPTVITTTVIASTYPNRPTTAAVVTTRPNKTTNPCVTTTGCATTNPTSQTNVTSNSTSPTNPTIPTTGEPACKEQGTPIGSSHSYVSGPATSVDKRLGDIVWHTWDLSNLRDNHVAYAILKNIPYIKGKVETTVHWEPGTYTGEHMSFVLQDGHMSMKVLGNPCVPACIKVGLRQEAASPNDFMSGRSLGSIEIISGTTPPADWKATTYQLSHRVTSHPDFKKPDVWNEKLCTPYTGPVTSP